MVKATCADGKQPGGHQKADEKVIADKKKADDERTKERNERKEKARLALKELDDFTNAADPADEDSYKK